jgi:cytochrome P450
MTTTASTARGGPHDAELTAPLDDEAFYAGDPFPHYRRLRAEAPLAWNPRLGYWAASKHADVVAMSRDPATFCSGKGILTFEIGVEYPTPPTMMHTDPPEHTRYRGLVQPGFAPSRIRALEPAVRRRARELVDTIEAGSPLDVVATVTVPYPLMIIAALLGIPDDDWPRFYQWSEASIPGATDWSEADRQALMTEMHQYLLAATRQRRGDRRDDIISVLANVEVDGEQLTDDELVMFLNQLLVAGNETTRNTLSGGLWELAVRGDWERLVADRALIERTVEEMLRWTTPVIAFMRTATRDVEVRGRGVRAGDPVLLLYASANRDEEVFGPSAETFDVARAPNPHVAFGFGPHFCIGAALARLEARVLLEELLDRFTTLEPAGEIERSHSAIIAGVTRAPLVFDA